MSLCIPAWVLPLIFTVLVVAGAFIREKPETDLEGGFRLATATALILAAWLIWSLLR